MSDEKDVVIEIESDPFSMIPNDLVRNPNVSNDAYRIYGIIKSYIGIPNFKLYKNTVRKSFCGGEHTFKKGWKELKDLGYLIQQKSHINGRYVWSYKLLSKPQQDFDLQAIDNQSVEKQSVEIQQVDFQPVENQHSYKEVLNNNDLNNNYGNNSDTDSVHKNNIHEQERTETRSTIMNDPIDDYEIHIISNLTEDQYKAYKILLSDIQQGKLDSTKGNLLKYFEKMMNNGWRRESDNALIYNIVGHVRMNFSANSKNRQIANNALKDMGYDPYDFSWKS